MRNGIFATINIGASAFRMQISEFKGGEERTLESLLKPLRLGNDTFSNGHITLENVHNAVEILKNFASKLDEYGLWRNYKAICTSGVREAKNREFFLDHIFTNTGIELEIIDPTEEIYIKYLGVKNDIEKFVKYEKKGVMFANISSGNVAVKVMRDQIIVFSAALPYGSLRLREIFTDIPLINKHKAYRQYVEKMFISIKGTLPKNLSLKYLVCSGSSINLLMNLLKPAKNMFTRQELEELYESYKQMQSEQIHAETGLRHDEANVLLPTLETYLRMMDFVGTEKVYFSRLSFPNMLTLYYSGNLTDRGFMQRLRGTLRMIGEKYNYDRKHSQTVTRFALKLYDGLQSIHSLGRKYRYLLEAGAILHDIGYFIGGEKHHQHSFYIANSIDIPGLTKSDKRILGYLVLMHRRKISSEIENNFVHLPVKEQLVIKKLVSILRLSDGLDASHSQPVTDIDVITKPNKLIIKAKTKVIPFMERLAFERKKNTFTDTFGIPVELETRILYE